MATLPIAAAAIDVWTKRRALQVTLPLASYVVSVAWTVPPLLSTATEDRSTNEELAL